MDLFITNVFMLGETDRRIPSLTGDGCYLSKMKEGI